MFSLTSRLLHSCEKSPWYCWIGGWVVINVGLHTKVKGSYFTDWATWAHQLSKQWYEHYGNLLRMIAYGKHFLHNVIFGRRHVLIITQSKQEGLLWWNVVSLGICLSPRNITESSTDLASGSLKLWNLQQACKWVITPKRCCDRYKQKTRTMKHITLL